MKKVYRVTIEEVCSKTFEIEAESEEEAMNKGIDGYHAGELVLDPGELISKSISVEDSEFKEF